MGENDQIFAANSDEHMQIGHTEHTKTVVSVLRAECRMQLSSSLNQD
jgi:hypothetical protein